MHGKYQKSQPGYYDRQEKNSLDQCHMAAFHNHHDWRRLRVGADSTFRPIAEKKSRRVLNERTISCSAATSDSKTAVFPTTKNDS